MTVFREALFIIDHQINNTTFFTSTVRFPVLDYLMKYEILSLARLENLSINLYFRFEFHEKDAEFLTYFLIFDETNRFQCVPNVTLVTSIEIH